MSRAVIRGLASFLTKLTSLLSTRSSDVSRMEAARLPEMTPPAISHYRTGKRGYRIVFEGDARGPLSRLGRDLKDGRVEDLASRICEICIQIRGENLLEGSCGTDA